jgi:hypothetical protein
MGAPTVPPVSRRRIPGRQEITRYGRDLARGLRRYTAVGTTLLVFAGIILASPAIESTDETEVATPGEIGAGDGTIAAEIPAGSDGAAGTTGAELIDPVAQADSDEALPENCDPETGRIRFPSIYAPPCVHPVADNGGATHMGVTEDEIKVVFHIGQPDASAAALAPILAEIGIADTAEDILDVYLTFADMFNTHYETYGRRVVFDFFQATGPSSDDAASRRDAISIMEHEPFVVMGGPSAFIEAVTRRGVPVISQTQRPNDYFAARAPYLWGTQMDSTQVFLLLAEYIGKRLAGDRARHAGSDDLRSQERKFGIIYLDNTENVYRPGVDFLERELATYGVELTDRIPYESDLDRAQEQARTIITRFKDRGITSVLFSGDPFALMFLTQEATNQGYFPEYVSSGGTLVDTIFAGRNLFDQRQWQNAFGFSQLWPRPPQEVTEPYYQHVWHSGREPASENLYEIFYQEMQLLFTGIHMAGPHLTPYTLRDGLFAYPPSGVGSITQLQRSWGDQVWPFPVYTMFDTVVEVWWDPNAVGEAEQGSVGPGMWQFMNGGRRYGPGEWPDTPPQVGVREGAITQFDDLPPQDVYPIYD